MLEVSNFVKNIIDNIYIPNNFGINLDEDWSDHFDDFVGDIERTYADVSVHHGVSKAVLVSDKENVVVKIPFNGYFEYTEDESEDDNESYGYFIEFEEANNSKNGWDYCQTELEAYQTAQQYKLEKFFAEVEKTKNGCYIQEKCVCYAERKNTNTNENSLKTAKKLYDSYCYRFATSFIADCIDYYGEAETDKFLAYVDEFCLNEDMHNSNYGYAVSDGRPVLIDYSGWMEE